MAKGVPELDGDEPTVEGTGRHGTAGAPADRAVVATADRRASTASEVPRPRQGVTPGTACGVTAVPGAV